MRRSFVSVRALLHHFTRALHALLRKSDLDSLFANFALATIVRNKSRTRG